MDARLTAALAAGRVASALTRTLNLGGGTVLPGHVAARIHPEALEKLARRLTHGSVLVSGTNGKTTTARVLASVARAAGLSPVHNRAGANLPAGLIAALTSSSSLTGRLRGDLGVFEVDEAHVGAVAAAIRPRVLVLTNLFRDQLDRYGEIDFVARSWEAAVADLGRTATLVLNVDDPVIAWLAGKFPGQVLTFGLADRAFGEPLLAHEADRRLCPACGARLRYTWCYYGHLGSYRCEACSWGRPAPDLSVDRVDLEKTGARFDLREAGKVIELEIPLAGLHNVYNAAAAAAAARALGLDWSGVVAGLAAAEGVFGRQERVPVGSGSLTLTLVKNPVGFNQALRTVVGEPQLLIAINDRFADGTDISWLWDVDFELLAESRPRILCTGLRAHDMGLRLKYAGIADFAIEPDLSQALDRTLATAAKGADMVALCTYTATLEARRRLQQKRFVTPFWEN